MRNKVYTLYENGITAVDFPINNYLVAMAMKVSGDQSAAPFRFYMVLYSCVGLFFLFLLVYKKSASYLLAASCIIFLFGSAVYLDYQDGLIPSMSAMSNVFIAAYFLELYWSDHKRKSLIVSVLFLSLSALMRTPYALFLIALLLEWGLRVIKKSNPHKFFELCCIGVALLPPLLYYFYNGHLRAVYGTLFLSKPLPPTSWAEVSTIFKTVIEKWSSHYWSFANYLLLAIVPLMGLFLLPKWRTKIFQRFLSSRLSVWVFISSFGGVAYMLLMLHQFSQHDYYLLDSLFVPTILVLVMGLVVLYREVRFKKILALLTAAIVALGCTDSFKTLKQRRAYDPTSIEQRSFESYRKGNSLLARLGIDENKKLLIPDTYAPNLPLILLQREGYSVPYPTVETIDTIMQWEWDYILLQDYQIERLFAAPYPNILDTLQRIGGDGRISVCKRSKLSAQSGLGLINWFGIENKTPFLVDTTYQSAESFIASLRGANEGWVKPEVEYDLSKVFEGIDTGSDNGVHLVVEMDYDLFSNDKDIFLTVVLEQPDKTLLTWQACPLRDFLPDSVGNRHLQKFFGLPELNPNQKLMVSIWNPGKNEMYYRNLRLSLYDGED